MRLSWYSPKNVRVTPAFGDTLTQGYLAVCGCFLVQSRECQRYTSIRRYSDTGVPSGVQLSWYSPRNVRVTCTPAFEDTLTQGYLVVCGCFLVQSRECQRYTSIRGYSDTGVPSSVRLSQYSPGNVRVVLVFGDTLTQGYLVVCGCRSTVQGMSELHWRSGIV